MPTTVMEVPEVNDPATGPLKTNGSLKNEASHSTSERHTWGSLKHKFLPLDVTTDGGSRRVTYNDRDHLSVLCQMHGSVWPKVLPFCVFNACLFVIIFYVREIYSVDLTFSSLGHKYMAIIAAFLLVSRNKIVLNRFWEARAHLGTCFRSCQELVSLVAVLTIGETGAGAKSYRLNVSHRTILLLRVAMASLEYKNTNRAPWRVPEMPREEQIEFEELFPSLSENDHDAGAKAVRRRLRRTMANNKWAQTEEQVLSYDALRPPLVLGYQLRETILFPRNGTSLVRPFKIPEELRLLDQVNAFMKAYHSLIKVISSPVPFPWIQMARTFAFFWVFTMPFALCHNAETVVQPALNAFFITYGFVGLAFVTMELDDPFGDDPNDFDDLGMARNVMEMICAILGQVDGAESVLALRLRLSGDHGSNIMME